MPEYTNKQKVAILLIYLGPDLASQVLKYLDEYQVEEICREISRLGMVDRDTVINIVTEFYKYVLYETGAKGGMGYLRELLELTLGPGRAMTILNRLNEVQPFTYLRNVSPGRLVSIIGKEHPQTIALILSYISPVQAAGVLSQLPDAVKLEVSMRIANSKAMQSEAINEINRALEKAMGSQGEEGSSVSISQSGTKTLAEILTRIDLKTESGILDSIQKNNGSLAEEVRKHMFLFGDIVRLDEMAVQRIIREVDSKDLTLSLKLAEEPVKEKIFKNMSERARDILKEEMGYLGPVRIRQVEEAQQRILETIRRLEQAGEIVIPKRGSEEKLV